MIIANDGTMTADRHQRLLAWLNERGYLSVGEIAPAFGVTAMTVWRDLRVLAELGLLRRVRGGARALGVAAEAGFERKEVEARPRKEAIAAEAVRAFVREGTVIVLEGGTTVAAMLPHLPEERVSLLTNSLPVAHQARLLRPRLPLRLIGGWMSPVSGNLTGAEAHREIARLRADLCFLGASAFDAELGPTDPNPLEIEVKRAFSAISRRTILLLDAGKFGHRAAAVTLHPRRINDLVTDAPPPDDVRARLRAHGVRLHVAVGDGKRFY